jgi:hypothetical protein
MAITPQRKSIRSTDPRKGNMVAGRTSSMAFAVLVIALVAIAILVLLLMF